MIQPHDGAAAAGAPNQNVFINSDVAGAEGEWLLRGNEYYGLNQVNLDSTGKLSGVKRVKVVGREASAPTMLQNGRVVFATGPQFVPSDPTVLYLLQSEVPVWQRLRNRLGIGKK